MSDLAPPMTSPKTGTINLISCLPHAAGCPTVAAPVGCAHRNFTMLRKIRAEVIVTINTSAGEHAYLALARLECFQTPRG